MSGRESICECGWSVLTPSSVSALRYSEFRNSYLSHWTKWCHLHWTFQSRFRFLSNMMTSVMERYVVFLHHSCFQIHIIFFRSFRSNFKQTLDSSHAFIRSSSNTIKMVKISQGTRCWKVHAKDKAVCFVISTHVPIEPFVRAEIARISGFRN